MKSIRLGKNTIRRLIDGDVNQVVQCIGTPRGYYVPGNISLRHFCVGEWKVGESLWFDNGKKAEEIVSVGDAFYVKEKHYILPDPSWGETFVLYGDGDMYENSLLDVAQKIRVGRSNVDSVSEWIPAREMTEWNSRYIRHCSDYVQFVVEPNGDDLLFFEAGSADPYRPVLSEVRKQTERICRKRIEKGKRAPFAINVISVA